MAKVKGLELSLRIPAMPLANDYQGYVQSKLDITMRRNQALKCQAIFNWLTGQHATVSHPRDSSLTKPVYERAHVVNWLFEQIELTGEMVDKNEKKSC